MERLRPTDPTTVGGFELVGRLGAGSLGVVYLASRGVESVAVKVMREAAMDEPSLRERFRREIETLKHITSPHVARIIDHGVDCGGAWFATEFVNGPNLKQHIETNGPMDDSQWWSLTRGLLNGLVDIHRHGVVHRDVKPANIVLADGLPKIIDFGVAETLDATSLTSTGVAVGSPAWFSPEQINGQQLEPSTDLFSAGSVLTYAATGSTPWGHPNTLTQASIMRIGVVEPDLSGLSAIQREVVEPLIVTNPSARRVSPLVTEGIPQTPNPREVALREASSTTEPPHVRHPHLIPRSELDRPARPTLSDSAHRSSGDEQSHAGHESERQRWARYWVTPKYLWRG